MAWNNRVYVAAFVIALLGAMLTDEVDCKKRLIMGRKSITRTYYKEPAIPAWACVLLVGIGLLIGGGILYALVHKIYLHDEQTYKAHSRGLVYQQQLPVS